MASGGGGGLLWRLLQRSRIGLSLSAELELENVVVVVVTSDNGSCEGKWDYVSYAWQVMRTFAEGDDDYPDHDEMQWRTIMAAVASLGENCSPSHYDDWSPCEDSILHPLTPFERWRPDPHLPSGGFSPVHSFISHHLGCISTLSNDGQVNDFRQKRTGHIQRLKAKVRVTVQRSVGLWVTLTDWQTVDLRMSTECLLGGWHASPTHPKRRVSLYSAPSRAVGNFPLSLTSYFPTCGDSLVQTVPHRCLTLITHSTPSLASWLQSADDVTEVCLSWVCKADNQMPVAPQFSTIGAIHCPYAGDN